MEKGYVIQDNRGLYYAGHGGLFVKELRKARFFKSINTAIRHYWNKTNYDNLKVLEVAIETKNPINITDELYTKFNNYNYQSYKRNLNKRGS